MKKKASPLRGVLIALVILLIWPYTRNAVITNLGLALAVLAGIAITTFLYVMFGARRR